MKKLQTPCAACGWKYQGFHICVDLSAPVKTEAREKRSHPTFTSPEHVRRLNEMRDERWRRHRDKNSERDAKMIALYKEGYGFRRLAKEFNVAYQTARGVIHRAADRGEVEVAPRSVKRFRN